MNIDIIDPDPDIDVSLFHQVVRSVLKHEQISASFINVVFISNAALRKLKRQYFGLDVYTDVIAFNLNDPDKPLEGEIYLSLEQIRENARDYGTRVHEELHRVLIHGCLHLCGWEDDTEESKAAMTRCEDHYLALNNLLAA